MKRRREEPSESSNGNAVDFECSECSKRFATKVSLNQHMEMHNAKVQCIKCEKYFSFRSSLKRHERLVHSMHQNESQQTTRTFTCNICNTSFHRRYHLDRHIATTHQQSTRSTFTCRHCNAVFNSYRQLVEHVEQEHPFDQQGGKHKTKSKSLYENSDDVSTNGSKTTSSIPLGNGEADTHKEDTSERNNVENTRSSTDESAFGNKVQHRILIPRQNERYNMLTFFANVRNEIINVLRSRLDQLRGIKWNLCVQVEMQRDDGNETATSSLYFRSQTYTFLSAEDSEEHDLNEALQKIFASLEKYMREGSGWFVKQVIKLEIHTVVYKPLSGSSYIPLPKTISKSKSVLNIRNVDNKCFLYCILASIHPNEIPPECPEMYYSYENELNMNEIQYPVKLADIRKFENRNENISVNVFTFDDGSIVPIRVTNCTNRSHHVNLLWLKTEDTSHYCLIRDFNRFLSRTKTHRSKMHFCPYCLHAFVREDLLLNHQQYCSTHGPQRVILPSSENESILTFKEYGKTLKVPFVIYADFETINVKLHTCMPNPDYSATTPTAKLEVCGFGYKVVCEDERYTKSSVTYQGPDASRKLIECLLQEQKQIEEILSHIEPLPDHEGLIDNANECCLCKKNFTMYDRAYRRIVAHHNHLTGNIIGAACNDCNLNCKQATFTCVIFHNLKNFDAHILCESLGQFKEHKLMCIPQTEERYISFSLGKLRFLDSFQFLPSSLETLAENLIQDGRDAFQNLYSEYENHEQADLLTRKGVYPYEYMDSFERFDEPQLPPIEAFYSSLKKEHISKEDYAHAQRVFNDFNMLNLGDYHQEYVKVDVLLLADIFESFRKVCLNQYELDPCHFYTSPNLSWTSLLKMTGVQLELIQDIDQMLMVEAGIRGGLSQISNRYKKANNPYLDDYDDTQPNSYLMYLDANNLYGWAMIQPLPISDFQFLDDLSGFDVMTIPEAGETGYILEVSLHYPHELHDLHNCLPLAPERKTITNEQLSPYAKQLLRKLHGLSENEPLPSRSQVEKLLATLGDKDHYVIHYRNLQLYLQLGMKLKDIHRVLQFRQKPWMKPYIDFNTEMRKKAKSTFEKNFYKLMNVSVFGKTMQNVRKHRTVELVHTEERLQKLTAKATFKSITIFREELIAVELLRSKVKLNKPSYCGMCILDLSKYMMYIFWFNQVKRRYGNKAQLLMTDTDSFLFCCETNDIYHDMLLSSELYDTSDYPLDHKLHSNHNKKSLGKMKDETNGSPINEFVGLRSKMYSFLCNKKEEKRAKGISKVVVKKEIKHEHYRNALFNETSSVASMVSLRSHRHALFCETVQKSGLSSFDDKRYLINNTSSYAYSHHKIVECDNSKESSIQPVEEDSSIKLMEEEPSVVLMKDQSFMLNDFKIIPCISK